MAKRRGKGGKKQYKPPCRLSSGYLLDAARSLAFTAYYEVKFYRSLPEMITPYWRGDRDELSELLKFIKTRIAAARNTPVRWSIALPLLRARSKKSILGAVVDYGGILVLHHYPVRNIEDIGEEGVLLLAPAYLLRGESYRVLVDGLGDLLYDTLERGLIPGKVYVLRGFEDPIRRYSAYCEEVNSWVRKCRLSPRRTGVTWSPFGVYEGILCLLNALTMGYSVDELNAMVDAGLVTEMAPTLKELALRLGGD